MINFIYLIENNTNEYINLMTEFVKLIGFETLQKDIIHNRIWRELF